MTKHNQPAEDEYSDLNPQKYRQKTVTEEENAGPRNINPASRRGRRMKRILLVALLSAVVLLGAVSFSLWSVDVGSWETPVRSFIAFAWLLGNIVHMGFKMEKL